MESLSEELGGEGEGAEVFEHVVEYFAHELLHILAIEYTKYGLSLN